MCGVHWQRWERKSRVDWDEEEEPFAGWLGPGSEDAGVSGGDNSVSRVYDVRVPGAGERRELLVQPE